MFVVPEGEVRTGKARQGKQKDWDWDCVEKGVGFSTPQRIAVTLRKPHIV